MADLDSWAHSVTGRYIDVDQWEGNQCWDLSQHWLTACNGGVLWTQPSNYPGMAAGSWEVATGNTANTADMLRHVTPIPGTERGLPGDILIFAYGAPAYPISHTAVLMQDNGDWLDSISQNSSPARPDLPGYSERSSGPTIRQNLTRNGLLGFLRPKANITGQTSGTITPIPSFTEMDIDMATPSEVVAALMKHEMTLRDGTKASLETHLVNLFGDTIKRTEVLTAYDGKSKARVIDILANLGPDLRAVKTKTDKLK